MKYRYDRTALKFLAGAALFAGFMIAACVGPFFPSMFNLTSSLICRGTVEAEGHNYSYGPNHGGNYVEVYCRSSDGVRKEITFRAVALTGLAASVPVFTTLFVWLRLRKSDWILESGRIPDSHD